MTDQPKEPTPADVEKADEVLGAVLAGGPLSGMSRERYSHLREPVIRILHSHAEEAVKAATEELQRDVEQLARRCDGLQDAVETQCEAREKAEKERDKADEVSAFWHDKARDKAIEIARLQRERDAALAEVERLKIEVGTVERERRAREKAEGAATALSLKLGETEGRALRAGETITKLFWERDDALAEVRRLKDELLRGQEWAEDLRKRVEELEAKTRAWKRSAKEHRVSAECWRQEAAQARREGAADVARSIRQPWWLVWNCKDQVWWRSDRGGYAVAIDSAGRYSLSEALRCCDLRSKRSDGKPNEIVVPSPELIAALPIDPPKAERPMTVCKVQIASPYDECGNPMPCPTHYPDPPKAQGET